MATEADNFGVALYYPFINVQDIDWLKGALLYWDAVRCITPSKDFFDGSIRYLCDEGAIIATDPKRYTLNAGAIFLRKMQKYCDNQGELDNEVIRYLDVQCPELKNIAIHSGKISKRIFQELGHKVVLGHFHEGTALWYRAQPYITALYLMVLAIEMSKSIKAPMLTDVRELSGLGQHILWSDEIIPGDTAPDNVLMQLDIDFPSSEALANIPFEDIIRFRQKRNNERRRFRSVIEQIRSTAQGLEDINALSDYLSEKKQDIQQAINDHKKTLINIGIKSFTSSIKSCWPSVFGIDIGNMAGTTAGILSAIGLAGISIAYSRTIISQEYQEAIKNCPWHYLIELENEL